MIVLKNINGKITAKINFRGKYSELPPKHSLILKDDEEGRAKAVYILSTYGFVVDITERILKEQGGELDENENIKES